MSKNDNSVVGKVIKMELDTGSVISVVSHSEYEKTLKNTKNLHGRKIVPIEVMQVNGE